MLRSLPPLTPLGWFNFRRSMCVRNRAFPPFDSQLPIRTIPAEHLFKPRDVGREKVVEENSLLPIHHPLIWHNIPVFAAHRTQRLETEKGKNGSERFALFILELFKLH